MRIACTEQQSETIDRLIDDLDAENASLRHWCKTHRMLPLLSTLIYTWALHTDGTISCIDHEAFGYPHEVEDDQRVVFAALQSGLSRYPELASLVPAKPSGLSRCDSCEGVGSFRDLDGSWTQLCQSCDGLGWA